MAGLKSHKVNQRRTICEVHREIYDELEEKDGCDHIVVLLEEAYRMGKKMSDKLFKYKKMFADLPENENYDKSVRRRASRRSGRGR